MGTSNQHRMGRWYEGLCRHAISRIYRLPISEVHSGHLKGAGRRRKLLRHQIDLYWKTTDGVCEYDVFANAKWREETVGLPEMMALIGVWRDIGAHKAMLITNTGFDIGVVNQAVEKGVGLMVVRPKFELCVLQPGKLEAIVGEIEAMAAGREGEVFEMEMIHKGFGEGTEARRHEGTEGNAEGAGGGRGDAGMGGRGEGGVNAASPEAAGAGEVLGGPW